MNACLERYYIYIANHVKHCIMCRQQICTHRIMHQLHLEVPSVPMYLIAVDLIAKFKPLCQGHQYSLTVIDMLTSYPWYILLYPKEADKVVHTYLVNIYSTFGGLHKIMSGSRTELKKTSFSHKLLPLQEHYKYLVLPITPEAICTSRMYMIF